MNMLYSVMCMKYTIWMILNLYMKGSKEKEVYEYTVNHF